MPIESLQVYCDGCGSGHNFEFTDTYGNDKFSDTYSGIYPLLVKKDGYKVIDPIATYPDGSASKNVTVNGDTRFDIQLARRDSVARRDHAHHMTSSSRTLRARR